MNSGARDRQRGDADRPELGMTAGGGGSSRAECEAPIERAADPLPLTVSVEGLDGSAHQAGKLQATLRQMHGVVRAYVSPMTALVYIDYLPDLVIEVELIDVISAAGYHAGAAERRFTWRRAQ